MQGKHILVVEDEAPIRDMVRFALERKGLSVAEAADVQEARLAMASRRPDLLLLDWMLPGVSGIEFAREIRADSNLRDLPIIMLTARAEEEDKVRGQAILHLGATGTYSGRVAAGPAGRRR